MKYDHTSKPHASWKKDSLCSKFLDDMKLKVLDKILKPNGSNHDNDYILGKFNLLKNDGFISVDQQAHTDYPPRQVM